MKIYKINGCNVILHDNRLFAEVETNELDSIVTPAVPAARSEITPPQQNVKMIPPGGKKHRKRRTKAEMLGEARLNRPDDPEPTQAELAALDGSTSTTRIGRPRKYHDLACGKCYHRFQSNLPTGLARCPDCGSTDTAEVE